MKLHTKQDAIKTKNPKEKIGLLDLNDYLTISKLFLKGRYEVMRRIEIYDLPNLVNEEDLINIYNIR